MSILVTGGAGFIGSNFIHHFLEHSNETVINIDKLNYAGNLDNFTKLDKDDRYIFFKTDLINHLAVSKILSQYKPRAIINFAAESHVDNSIKKPYDFVSNNVLSILSLLNVTLQYFSVLEERQKESFRFIQISTDEVYGSLSSEERSFTESSQYSPNSPYAASKASADHLARAWHHTFDLPIITSNCSNNYGPRQFPEKLIPVVISKALSGSDIPLYGDGMNIRDWIYVDDHCEAISMMLKAANNGETYNVGGNNQMTNKDVVLKICGILDQLIPLKNKYYSEQIKYIEDRRGHDRRYSIDCSKIKTNIGWEPKTTFDVGIKKTIEWYLANPKWLRKSLNKINKDEITKTEVVPITMSNNAVSSVF